jgi:valyl-tRNA synthetase
MNEPLDPENTQGQLPVSTPDQPTADLESGGGESLAGALDALEALIRHSRDGFVAETGLLLPDVPVLYAGSAQDSSDPADSSPPAAYAAPPAPESAATTLHAPAPDSRREMESRLLQSLDVVVDRALREVNAELRSRILTEMLGEVRDILASVDLSPVPATPATRADETLAPVAATIASSAVDNQTSDPMTSTQPPAAEPVVAAALADMPRTYDPVQLEQHWYGCWEERGDFKPSGQGQSYCIMLPPPNVTGSLHMGHAFQDTLMDALIRWQRMCGRDVLWQAGTDHAGIATQMVVERQLAQRGQSREAMGREAFTEAVWDWKAQSGGTIMRQLRRMGTSMDWSRERFTLDEGLSAAVTEVFVRLYEEGLIYRGKRLVNWDPVLHTAISDLEVIAEEEQGHLWHIQYPLANGNGHVVVATTRPETLLGDAAIAVHPEDDRYRALVGSRVVLPLTGRTIPVIADEYVDPAFGSGCVKITPAHDFNDYAVGARHGLPRINIFTPDARINDNGPAPYRGLDRYEARKLIVADLESRGLLLRVDDHKLMVPRGDRSGAVIEPYLTDQWYVRIAPLAEPAIRAVQEGKVRFVPENWSKTYFEWMNNIQDWCISRQLWWGHRIPAWYDDRRRVHVGRSEAEIRAREGLGPEVTLTQDSDVLDTWFSSALWPFSTLGWPESTAELKRYYPTSVLVTGFDIIFFWVARMMMFGIKFMGDVPFREIYIHGLVRDAEGQKMSKSRGNVLDPIDLIDGIALEALVAKRTQGLMKPQEAPRIEAATRRQYPDGIPGFGTDALRFTFASLATQGRDVRFDLGRIEGNRNFCNKLWNATRFVMGGLDPDSGPLPLNPEGLGVAERYIRSRLAAVTRDVDLAFASYRFDLAAQALYEFAWNEYCDWYLELTKTVLQDPGATPAARLATQATLVHVLDALLRLLHPLMPFITEDLWQRLRGWTGAGVATIQHAAWPDAGLPVDSAAEAEVAWIKEFVLGVRRIRGEMNIPPGKPLKVLLQPGSMDEAAWLESARPFLLNLARLAELQVAGPEVPESATALAGQSTLLIPLADLIDPEAESRRLGKEIERLKGDRDRTEAKLANASFVERAPAEVVGKERSRLAEINDALERLEAQQQRVLAMRPD